MTSNLRKPFYHVNSCARCGLRLDRSKNKKIKRKIRQDWLIKYFDLINIDIKYYKFICMCCFKKLSKKNKENKLFEQVSQDKQEIDNIKQNYSDALEINSQLINSKRILSLTGLTIRQFFNLFNSIKEKWQHSFNLKNILFLYLVRLRHGISISKTINIFPLLNERTIYDQFKKLRIFLVNNFVASNLGINNITREEMNTKYTKSISKKLYNADDDSIVTVWDGTYVYIEKSSNYKFQKETYSLHKGRNLVKMMMVVSTTGFKFNFLINSYDQLLPFL